MLKRFNALSLSFKLVILAIVGVLGFVAFNFVDDLFSKEEEVAAEVNEERADAAIESGEDAVNTVTNVHTKEVERYETVRTITKEVNDAQDFDSAHDAGANGLCVGFGVCPDDDVQQPSS